jgi:RNA polymerase sigma factor (sigma-70 family)
MVINKFSKRLFDFGIRFCQDEDVVKDCIQQMFHDLWNRGFDVTERDTIKSYLFKSIRNRVIREKAKWDKNESLEEEHDFRLEFGVETTIIAETADVELALKVERVLNALPPKQREIIYLRFYEGLDVTQISNVMNINRQSAHNLMQKAYHNIRSEWPAFYLVLSLLQFQHIN